MLRIDLGCGKKKQPGFIGVDRFPLAGVDVIADLNRSLPFHDDSVDLVLASHSLEHVENLIATIKDVSRICKHGAQLCIVAPYGEQKLNWANPYHTCVFNEHTPRFWTDYPDAPVDPQEYDHPHASTWGLSNTDNSNPGIDIRTVRMEYFYFPRYAGLPPAEQRRLRQERTDVCEQIMYHLIVWKGGGKRRGRTFDDYVAKFQPYEPGYIGLLRDRGREMQLQNRAAAQEEAPASTGGDAEQLHSKLLAELSADRERQTSFLEELRLAQQQELAAAKDEADRLRAHAASLTGEITRLHEHSSAQAEVVARLSSELRSAPSMEQVAVLTRQIQSLQADLEALRLAHQQQHSALSAASEAARQSCAAEVRVSERLRQELTGAKDEASQLRDHCESLTRELSRLHGDFAAQTEAAGRLTTELHDTAAYNRILRDEAVRIERDLEFARTELRRESAEAAASREEAASLVRQNHELKATLESNEVLRAKLGLTRAELETTATLLGLQRQKEDGLRGELAGARREAAVAAEAAERSNTLWSVAKRALSVVAGETRIPEFVQVARAGGFLIGRDRQIQGLPAAFVPLREYSDRHFHTSRACIVLGGDLSETAYREYVVPFALDRLTAVSFAIRPLVPESSGVAGVEIVSARSEILAHVRRDLTTIDRDGVAEFRLPAPVAGLEKNWFLRVFVHASATPVAVYELLRGALFRGTPQSFPLVLFS